MTLKPRRYRVVFNFINGYYDKKWYPKTAPLKAEINSLKELGGLLKLRDDTVQSIDVYDEDIIDSNKRIIKKVYVDADSILPF